MTRARVRATAKAFGASAFAAVVVAAAALLTVSAGPAEALPSYARQTGQPCATCHTAFPELTPYGRRFKIGGYTAGGGDWKGPPVAMMYMPSFTHTQSDQDSPPAPGLHTNDNLVSQQVSGFIAGQLYGNLGSFIQITGDPTVAGTAFVDASDVRYADTLTLFGKGAVWGIDANNTPTVEDPWNTTPSFGWPQISSTVAPAFGPPLTHLENGYGQIVGGAGAYMFWNDMLYADLTFYKGLPVPVLQAFNTGNSTTDALSNVAPYWRVAIEPHWGDLYWEVGTLGMYGRVTPGRVYGYGTDDFLDVGFDSQIQYAGDQYSITVKLTDIMEWQKLNASFGQGYIVEPQRHAQQLQGQCVVRLGSHLQRRLRLFQRRRFRRLQSLRLGQQPQLRPCEHRRVQQQLHQQSERRRPHRRSRLPPIQPRRAVSLFDLERAARPAIHPVPASLWRHDQLRRLVSRRHA